MDILLTPPGKYRAKVTDYGITTVKSGPSEGNPAPFVQLEICEGTRTGDHLTWQGSFNVGKAFEIAMKALETCGFSGDLERVALGKAGGALRIDCEVQIVVTNQPKTDGDGYYARVEYINPVGSTKEMMSPEEFKRKIASMGLMGRVAEYKRSQPPKSSFEASRAANNPLDDFPF